MAVKSVFKTDEICDRPGSYISSCNDKAHIGVVQRNHIFPKCERCGEVEWTLSGDAETLNSAEFVEGNPVEYDGEQRFYDL